MKKNDPLSIIQELDERLSEIEKKQKQEIKSLRELVLTLQSSLQERENNDYNAETDAINDNSISVFPSESDREEKSIVETDNHQENSIVNDKNDTKYSENVDSQMNTETDNNSNGSYQSFYRLIKNRELICTEVTATKENLEETRSGNLNEVRFSNDPGSNYWIVKWEEVYCLIPKENIKFNKYQYDNFQRVFDCQEYKGKSSDFEVIEPAIVVRCNSENWQLERKGKIKFI